MFDNEIISPNEKIKKIRKQILRTTQDEIAKDICSKSMISQIENNKENLTFFLAAGISKNCNRVAKEKNIKIELIKPEDLMKDEDTQANEIFENDILKEIKGTKEIKTLENKLCEAEKLIKKYNIIDSKAIELYKAASNVYFSKCIYSKCDEMCDNGLKICINSQNSLEEAHFYISKARNNLELSNFMPGLHQLEYAEKINKYEKNDELFQRIYFNKALTYIGMKLYSEALSCLKILKVKVKEQSRLLDFKMLYANCLNEMYNYKEEKEEQLLKEAEKEYIEILEPAMKINNKDFIALTYRNLAELYLNQKNYKISAETIKESYKHNPGNKHLHRDLYWGAAKVLKYVDEDIEPYLLKALELCEKKEKENLLLLEKIFRELALLYEERKNENGIDFVIEKSYKLNIDYSWIFQHIAEYYRDIDKRKSIELNQESMKKSSEIKKY